MGLPSCKQQLLILIMLPLSAFAAITVTDRGTYADGTAAGTTNFAPTSTIVAGASGYLYIGADNAAGSSNNFPASTTDSAGNTWYRVTEQAGGASVNASVES